MKKQFVLLALLVSSGLMLGCNKKNSDDSSSKVRTTTRTISPNSTQNPNYWAQSMQSMYGLNWRPSTGTVYGNSSDFQSAVVNFLSPPMDASSIGSVDSNTGVQFQGIATFDNNGNLNRAQSGIIINVTDSYALDGQDPIQPIGIAGSDGAVNRTTGQVRLRFQDNYGAVILEGSYDYSYFQGVMTYVNANGSSRSLGTFRIDTCGFFVCGQ